MQRYFVDSSNWNQTQVTISGDDVHHISNVMRMTEGQTIVCVHPDFGAAVCSIEKMEVPEQIICKVDEWIKKNTELPVNVTIVQSLGKGDKMEQVVQKATELGADSFIPYQAERSVAKWDKKKTDKKIMRLKKIAKEASEQSERVKVPEIHDLLELNELLRMDSFDVKLLAFEDEARKDTYSSLRLELEKVNEGDSLLVIFGPEGGFSSRESNALVNSGFHSIRLGPRILRMETAPLYFLSAVSYHFEENE
ncbi:16S rRNA (uracil(1498)-N(3))-methyltransferase [Halobacillus sp. A1]|uniref:16S rRNA (uracil(1498)-N(3))-methyltransferase n=1 Tax=Halobacillus sp. A1 TaxID=2880262 RepID=UPI0020A65C5F|nr:16S rRNA (uracil(1498)-N(3))-methyltransferase [Halobacillus sp. A1]